MLREILAAIVHITVKFMLPKTLPSQRIVIALILLVGALSLIIRFIEPSSEIGRSSEETQELADRPEAQNLEATPLSEEKASLAPGSPSLNSLSPSATASPSGPDDPNPPSLPQPVATGTLGEPLPSTRKLAAQGKSVASILDGADMTGPNIRAAKVAEIKKLEEIQQNAVEDKARKLGIPLRIEGPGHKISTLYDIRGEEPLYRTTLNKNAAISSGVNLLAPAPYNLNGTGITVGVWDGGSVRSTHQELTGRVTKKNSNSANDDHATHVAGTIGASGVSPNAKGMAPNIHIDSYDWDSDYAEMTAAGAASAGDTSRIPLSNHSYGYEAATSDMGRYEAEAIDTDAIVRSLPYYLPFWAAGNEQDILTAKGGFQSITFNGLAKNIMTVGAVDDAVSGGQRSFNPAPASPVTPLIAYFSSLGPCDDGRIKPDVVANGIDLYSCVATSNSAYDGTYSGTSMATPSAMGSAALLAQLYAREFSGQRMRASTMKALLIHTADDIGKSGPDYTYGWGLINVKAASDLILAHKASLAAPKIIDGQITGANQTRTHTFTWDGISPIRATLCWTDPVGAEQFAADSRTANLINNLDAKITAPDSSTNYQPFVMPFVGTWTQASMSSSAVRGKNNVDNVEQVYLASPSQAGAYTITVSIDGSLTGGTQAYSLIVTGGTDVESNPPPSLTLTSPTAGATFLSSTPVTLSATATDLTIGGAPGAVTQVEFFNGPTSLGVDTTAPYSLSWTPPAAGTYSISAKATDNEAAISTSSSASITILSGDGSPVLSSFSSSSGGVGSLVILSGENFAGVTSVTFNGVEAEFIVDSSGQITVTVPPLATTGTLTVTNNFGTGTSVSTFTVVQAPVLISQIYGAGNNSGSIYKQDYVELYNRSESTVSLAGWSLQYASSSGTSWSAAPLSGTIAPGGYYLLGLAKVTSASGLTDPDISSTGINISATRGKVALLNTSTTLTGSSPLGNSALQDFVGYGTANASEGSPAPAPSTTAAIFRAGSGATDTEDNSADFTTAAPNPRNSTYTGGIPAITSAAAAVGTVDVAFSYQITASDSPASFDATGLPDGLFVNTTTGAITGTPTTEGTTSVILSATNISGTGTTTLTLTIAPATIGGGTITLLSEDFADLTLGNDAATNGPNGTELTSFNPNFPTSSKLYSAGGVAKLGSSSSAGSITSRTLDLSANGGNFFVSFKVKGWTTIEGAIKVTPTGLTAQTVTYSNNLSSAYETVTLSFSGGTAGSAITFETTAKRAFIDDILVFYNSSSTTPVITTTGTLLAVDSTYGSASPNPTSFSVSGADMTAGILVTPPPGFEVSLSSSTGYASSVTIPGSGTIPPTTVYLHLPATTTAGFYSGDIVCTSTGATPVTLTTATSEVRKKLLTITADDQEKLVGNTLTLGPGQSTFTSSGLVGSETIGTVTLTASGGTAPTDPAGIYSITPSSATGGSFDPNNYDLNYIDGTLTVTPGDNFTAWLSSYNVGSLTSLVDDPDKDGLPNAIENILGTAPDAPSTGLTQVSSNGTTLVFRHTRSNSIASDLTPSYEWSTDFLTWHASGKTKVGTIVTIAETIIIDNTAPANDLIEVTATVTNGTPKKLFVRLRATQR